MRALLFGMGITSALSASAQSRRIAVVTAAEVGNYTLDGLFGALAIEGDVTAELTELRFADGRAARFFSGCGDCTIQRRLTLVEIRAGRSFGGGGFRGWVLGLGVGLLKEDGHRPWLTLGPYLTHNWRVHEHAFIRTEGRMRLLNGRGQDTNVGGIARLGLGVVF